MKYKTNHRKGDYTTICHSTAPYLSASVPPEHLTLPDCSCSSTNISSGLSLARKLLGDPLEAEGNMWEGIKEFLSSSQCSATPSGKGDWKESNADSWGLGSGQRGELLGGRKESEQRKGNMSEISTLGNYRKSYINKKILWLLCLKMPKPLGIPQTNAKTLLATCLLFSSW